MVKKKNRKWEVLLAGAVAAGLLGLAQAASATTLIDLNYVFIHNTSTSNQTMAGAAVLGASGDTWNNWAGGAGPGTVTLNHLVNSADTATSVNVALKINSAYSAPSGTFSNTLMDSATTPLMMGYASNEPSVSGYTMTLTISGLQSSTNIELVLYGAGNHAGQGDDFSVTTGTFISGGLTTSAADRKISNGVGDAYNILNVTADPTGNVAVSITPNPGTTSNLYAVLNGFQLKEVPEPATLAMFASAGLGLLLIGRKRTLRGRA